NVVIQLGQLFVGYGNQLGIAASFVGHVKYANCATADYRARRYRIRSYHQHIQRIAVVGKGVGDKAVVGRVEHWSSHKTIHYQSVGFGIDFVLDWGVVGRDFDDDVDVAWQVFAGWDLA